MERMNSELKGIKRTLVSVCEVQQEILAAVKKIRKGVESEKFELGNCCHTVGRFFTVKHVQFFSDFYVSELANFFYINSYVGKHNSDAWQILLL